jgi:SAM-dependent methyltransferase
VRFLAALQDRYVGRRWSVAGETQNWWTSPVLLRHIEHQISDAAPGGVAGALRAATGGVALGRGLSIGCGSGAKEMLLLQHGCVESFDLYELAEGPAAEARAEAARLGLADRVTVRVANVFDLAEPDSYDLVYWDHSLHHMYDVEAALAFSIRVLRPGGWLAVNEYTGPTRLQWTQAQADLANAFLGHERAALGPDTPPVRPGSLYRRLRLYLRDPSEAPQSDLIEDSFLRLTGTPMKQLGGAMIHTAAPQVIGACGPEGEVIARLIAWDEHARAKGENHFSFGLWQKPLSRRAADDTAAPDAEPDAGPDSGPDAAPAGSPMRR